MHAGRQHHVAAVALDVHARRQFARVVALDVASGMFQDDVAAPAAGQRLRRVGQCGVLGDQLVEPNVPAVARINVEDNCAAHGPGRHRHVRIGMLGPPALDLLCICGRVVEAMFGDRLLGLRPAGEDRVAEAGVVESRVQEVHITPPRTRSWGVRTGVLLRSASEVVPLSL